MKKQIKMKTIHEKNKIKKEIKYPCLMEREGLVVLFFERKRGVVVSKTLFGKYHSDWVTERFTPLPNEDQIILQNTL